ncbi:MAG: 50S ribosomal protein L25/general stress protein Ctc [Polyangiaceae bacterium]
MTMELIKMTATRRTASGKGPSNRLRASGQIPAVAYGRDLQATHVAIAPKALLGVLGSDHGQNAVVELAIEGGETLTVMVRDYSYHPISRDLLHADFVSVKLDQPVDVDVPFRMTGKAKGVAEGGILQQIFRKIPVRCLPEKIPAFIEADVSDLGMGDSLKANALKLADGVKVRLHDDQTIAIVNIPEKGSDDTGAPAAGAPAAGAPAAGAAAPAAAAAAPAKGGAAPAAKAAAAAPAKADKKK